MIAHQVRRWLGMAGVPPHDNARAREWERRLHAPMIAIALGAVAVLYLTEFARVDALRTIGHLFEWLIFAAFSLELAWMLGLLLTRAGGSLRALLTPGGSPYVFGLAVIAFLIAGAGFYWLEPTIQTYAEGLWLAFVTGATVGYGDLVPTTTASRLFAVLIVLLGLTFFPLVTASIAAFFVGEDEKLLRKDMHADVRHLRAEVAGLIGDEERALRGQMHADIRDLREEVKRLRDELESLRRAVERGS